MHSCPVPCPPRPEELRSPTQEQLVAAGMMAAPPGMAGANPAAAAAVAMIATNPGTVAPMDAAAGAMRFTSQAMVAPNATAMRVGGLVAHRSLAPAWEDDHSLLMAAAANGINVGGGAAPGNAPLMHYASLGSGDNGLMPSTSMGELMGGVVAGDMAAMYHQLAGDAGSQHAAAVMAQQQAPQMLMLQPQHQASPQSHGSAQQVNGGFKSPAGLNVQGALMQASPAYAPGLPFNQGAQQQQHMQMHGSGSLTMVPTMVSHAQQQVQMHQAMMAGQVPASAPSSQEFSGPSASSNAAGGLPEQQGACPLPITHRTTSLGAPTGSGNLSSSLPNANSISAPIGLLRGEGAGGSGPMSSLLKMGDRTASLSSASVASASDAGPNGDAQLMALTAQLQQLTATAAVVTEGGHGDPAAAAAAGSRLHVVRALASALKQELSALTSGGAAPNTAAVAGLIRAGSLDSAVGALAGMSSPANGFSPSPAPNGAGHASPAPYPVSSPGPAAGAEMLQKFGLA